MKFSTITVDLLPLEQKNSGYYYESFLKEISEKFFSGTIFFMLTAAHQAALSMFMKFVEQALAVGAQELTITDELANNEDRSGTHLAVTFSYEPKALEAQLQTFTIRSEIKPAQSLVNANQLQGLSFERSLVLMNELLAANYNGSCDYVTDKSAQSELLTRRKASFAAPSTIMIDAIPSLGKMPTAAEKQAQLAIELQADICPFISANSSVITATPERRPSR